MKAKHAAHLSQFGPYLAHGLLLLKGEFGSGYEL